MEIADEGDASLEFVGALAETTRGLSELVYRALQSEVVIEVLDGGEPTSVAASATMASQIAVTIGERKP